ncbi:MAG: hypothetical protein DRP06_00525 [Candidatus Aenigmatarchaeota archaeon]|nr:MAG: hypothetical protein DRP06_00525 [Candidatus Aenigmarchaeota archaeon]
MDTSGRIQYLEINYGNSFGANIRGSGEEDSLFLSTPIPLQIRGNYNSRKKDSDFQEYSGGDKRNYLEYSPSSRQIARGVEFLERYGHLNPEASLKRLKKLENGLYQESDKWIREELTDSINLLRACFSSDINC